MMFGEKLPIDLKFADVTDTTDITGQFIDEVFLNYVREEYCEGRLEVTYQDVAKVEQLNVSHNAILSLRGIEYFKSLKHLDCSYNQLDELPIQYNEQLETLICSGNNLVHLHTNNNKAITHINCNRNRIIELVLAENNHLLVLDCGMNRLRELDISENKQLEELICYWNILSDLKLNSSTGLRRLHCSFNMLFDLELQSNVLLEFIDCSNNQLSSLDTSSCKLLKELRCASNQLKTLHIGENEQLQSLRCFNNQLSKLLLSLPELEEVYCSDNKLSVFDTSSLPSLKKADYSNNLIKEPDVTIRGMGTLFFDTASMSYSSSLLYKEQTIDLIASIKSETEMKKTASFVKKVWTNLEPLIVSALELIEAKHPDEDSSELCFNVIEVDEWGAVRLGFDAGETGAGQLVIYAEVTCKLKVKDELVYELY